MGNTKEAKARIKINKLLEEAGWRFFDNEKGQANISLEPNIKITQKDIDAFGEDFESTKNGFIDFLLLDEKGFPLVVLEAKKEDKNPLDGKEQARKYAHTENVLFVILSNGNLHYFWDLERGEPEIITEFPTQESLKYRQDFKPDNKRLADEELMMIISHSLKTNLKKILAIKMKRHANNIFGTKIYEFCDLISSKQFTLCKNQLKLEMIVFFLRWRQAQEKPLFPQPSSNYFCEQVTRKEFCF